MDRSAIKPRRHGQGGLSRGKNARADNHSSRGADARPPRAVSSKRKPRDWRGERSVINQERSAPNGEPFGGNEAQRRRRNFK
jgi:hypothetical protein